LMPRGGYTVPDANSILQQAQNDPDRFASPPWLSDYGKPAPDEWWRPGAGGIYDRTLNTAIASATVLRNTMMEAAHLDPFRPECRYVGTEALPEGAMHTLGFSVAEHPHGLYQAILYGAAGTTPVPSLLAEVTGTEKELVQRQSFLAQLAMTLGPRQNDPDWMCAVPRRIGGQWTA
jgi:hypothetical protein